MKNIKPTTSLTGSHALPLLTFMLISGCATQPYHSTTTTAVPAATSSPEVELQPVAPQTTVEPAEPLPAPVTRSYSLNAASRALVNQAHTQLAAKNIVMAAATIERALRIEPGNPLLWLEYAEVRMSEANYSQAESMARKALTLASGDSRTQVNAWRMIAASLRAQNKTSEAQQADARADGLTFK